MKRPPPPYDAKQVRLIAAMSDTDPRTVLGILEGRGRQSTAARVIAAIEALGLTLPRAKAS